MNVVREVGNLLELFADIYQVSIGEYSIGRMQKATTPKRNEVTNDALSR